MQKKKKCVINIQLLAVSWKRVNEKKKQNNNKKLQAINYRFLNINLAPKLPLMFFPSLYFVLFSAFFFFVCWSSEREKNIKEIIEKKNLVFYYYFAFFFLCCARQISDFYFNLIDWKIEMKKWREFISMANRYRFFFVFVSRSLFWIIFYTGQLLLM